MIDLGKALFLRLTFITVLRFGRRLTVFIRDELHSLLLAKVVRGGSSLLGIRLVKVTVEVCRGRSGNGTAGEVGVLRSEIFILFNLAVSNRRVFFEDGTHDHEAIQTLLLHELKVKECLRAGYPSETLSLLELSEAL